MPLKCLLISTNRATVPYPVYPLGIAHLAGALEDAGHIAHMYDALSRKGFSGLAAEIRSFAPELVAVSVRNVDNVDSTDPVSFMDDVKAAMEIIRRFTSAPVVIGGPAFSIFPEKFMELLRPDYGVVGQGEAVLVELARGLSEGTAPLPGIIRSDSRTGEWKPIIYDHNALPYYLSAGGMLNIQTKRGCPFRCTYCSYPLIEGRHIRYRSADEVADNAVRLAQELGARYLFFTDAVFNDPADHYLKVAEALITAGNQTPWCAFFRPSGLTMENLRILKRAGLAGMELGTDGATDETLEGFGKGFTFDQVHRCGRLALSQRIPCAHFCMFGGPGETAETLERGIANLEGLGKAVVFAFAGIRILPGTGIYDIALREGIIEQNQDILDPVFYYAPGMDFSTIDSRLKVEWNGRLDRIYPCSILYRQMKRLHHRGYTGPLWDILVRH